MKKFVMDKAFLEIFPDAKVGILVCKGIDNHVKDPEKFAPWLRECEEKSMRFVRVPEFSENRVVSIWRDAFRLFKTKKGARCSIEAMLKRVKNGDEIGCINPLVDIYNGISLKYGMPVGGETIDAFEGDLRLTVADGDEYFVTYGGDGESEPPRAGEVIYKDDGGAVCRCFNWRESVRTMLTEDTRNAFMIIETVGDERESVDDFEAALEELKQLIETELGGTVTRHYACAATPEVIICE